MHQGTVSLLCDIVLPVKGPLSINGKKKQGMLRRLSADEVVGGDDFDIYTVTLPCSLALLRTAHLAATRMIECVPDRTWRVRPRTSHGGPTRLGRNCARRLVCGGLRHVRVGFYLVRVGQFMGVQARLEVVR